MADQKQQSGTFSRGQLFGYIALCLIWGSTWLAIRIVVRDVPPLQAVAVRFLAAGVLLLGMALPYVLLFWAEQHVTSSMSAVLYSASPLTVSLITPVMMHRKVPRRAVY